MDASQGLLLAGAILLFIGGVEPHWQRVFNCKSRMSLEDLARDSQERSGAGGGSALHLATLRAREAEARSRRWDRIALALFVAGTLLTIAGTFASA